MSDKPQENVPAEERIRMLEARIEELEGNLKIQAGRAQAAGGEAYQLRFHLKSILDALSFDSAAERAIRQAQEHLKQAAKMLR